MALGTRTITTDFRQQHEGVVTMKFRPIRAIGSDDEVLLSKNYTFFTDDQGVLSFALPVKSTGSIVYSYELPGPRGDQPSTGRFNLEAGDAIDLSELIEAGSPIPPSLQEYVDQQIAALPLPPKVYVANILQDGDTTVPGEGDSVASVVIDELDLTFTYADTGTFLLGSPLFAQQENGNWPLVAGQLYQVTDPPASKVYFGTVSDLVHSGPGFVAMTILDPKTGMSAVDGWSGTLELRVWPNTAEPE